MVSVEWTPLLSSTDQRWYMVHGVDLDAWETAALIIQLGGFDYQQALQVLRKVEKGWSDPTYGRRLWAALVSLEQKSLVKRTVAPDRSITWQVTRKGTASLPLDQLSDIVLSLSSELSEARSQLSKLKVQVEEDAQAAKEQRTRATATEERLTELMKSQRHALEDKIAKRFPKLPLSVDWLEALILLGLLELMARYKLGLLSDSSEEQRDLNFTQLLETLSQTMATHEARRLDFNKDLLSGAYKFRNKMIHNGLVASIRPKELDAIRNLVVDLYDQLFE